MAKPVTVSVYMDDKTDPKQVVFKITVSEEPVRLGPGDDGIEWTIDTDGWFFTKDHHDDSTGIYIKKSGGKFHDKKGTPKKHKWDRVSSGGQYRYTISVTNDENHQETVVTWDPSIMN